MSNIKFTTSPNGKPVNNKNVGKVILGVVVALVAIIVLANGFAVVNEGFVGVKYRFGKIVTSDIDAGLTMKIPFIENIEPVDIRELVYEISTNAYTSDTQTVENLQIKLNYRYDTTRLSEIIQKVGVSQVEAKLIVPQVNSITKNAIGQTRAERLVNSRVDIQEDIQQKLTDSLAEDGIIVTGFALEDIDFENGFEEAVRAKVVAEQDALKAKNKTAEKQEEAEQIRITAKADADSTLLKAEADAEAMKMIQEQLASSPLYVEYLKAIKWDGVLPQAMGTEVNPFIGFTESKTTPETAE